MGEKYSGTHEHRTASSIMESAASTSDTHGKPEKSCYDKLPKDMKEMNIKDEKSDNHEVSVKDMEPSVVSGNGTETGQIIVTSIGGSDGQPKQTMSYMAECVV